MLCYQYNIDRVNDHAYLTKILNANFLNIIKLLTEQMMV